MPKEPPEPALEAWQQVMREGDRDSFHQMVDPYVDLLLKHARHELDYYIAQDYLRDGDFTAEEIVGETQIYAWEHREHCPERMSLRGWLLGTQHRLLRGLVAQQQAYRQDKALSLDEELPINPAEFHTQEWFQEWFQPDSELYWEDVIPSQEPVDIEVDLDEEGRMGPLQGDDTARHALLMHDEFEMPLPEVAFTLSRPVNETAGLIELARAPSRERIPLDTAIGEDDQPAPPEGSDE